MPLVLRIYGSEGLPFLWMLQFHLHTRLLFTLQDWQIQLGRRFRTLKL